METSNDSYLFTHIFLHVRDIPDSPPDSCSTVLSDSNKLKWVIVALSMARQITLKVEGYSLNACC